jgi:hypothetical protein
VVAHSPYNNAKSAATFCHQVTAWISHMDLIFYHLLISIIQFCVCLIKFKKTMKFTLIKFAISDKQANYWVKPGSAKANGR